MRGVALALALCGLGAPAAATDPAWPDFATCIARATDRFERALSQSETAPDAPDLALMSQGDVRVCGTLGIMTCDLREDRIACQAALVETQDALRDAVIESLPAPSDVSGQAGAWSDGLYPQLWDIAQGQSAGDDCAGASALVAAWCGANQSANRLANAMFLWQLGRLIGAAPSGIEAGWTVAPPPPQPTRRPGPAP